MNILYESNKLILQNILAGNSLQTLLDALHQKLEISLFILDLNGEITAFSADGAITDYFPNAHKSSDKYICFEFNEKKAPFGIGKFFFEEENAICVLPTPENLKHTVFYPIKANESPLGILALKTDSYEALKTLTAAAPGIASAVSEYLGNHISSIPEKNRLYMLTAKQLLLDEDPSISEEGISARLKSSSSKNRQVSTFSGPYAIAVFEAITNESKKDRLYDLFEYEYTFPHSFILQYDGRLYSFLFNADDSIYERLNDFGYQHQLFVGVSDFFTILSERNIFKTEAENALRFGKEHLFQNAPNAYLFKYSDHYADHLLLNAVNALGIKALILSDIFVLDSYDRKNNTFYLDTLEQYLKCNNSYTDAANALYINRGTLKYRLSKIKLLIENDFDDFETAKALSFSIALYWRMNTIT